MVVGNSVARGGVSSPLWGTAFRCALNALVLLLECALSGTLAFLRHHNCYLAQDKEQLPCATGALSAPFAATLRMVALRGGS